MLYSVTAKTDRLTRASASAFLEKIFPNPKNDLILRSTAERVKADVIIVHTRVLLKIASDIKGSRKNAVKRVSKKLAHIAKKRYFFFFAKPLRSCFPVSLSVNSSFGVYSSNSLCSKVTSSVFAVAVSPILRISPVKSKARVFEVITLLIFLFSLLDIGVKVTVCSAIG